MQAGYRIVVGLLFFGASFLIIPAQASTTGSVSAAKVTAGENTVEWRAGYSEADEDSSDDERFRSRIHIDHGFNDFYAAQLIASGDKRKDNNFEAESLTLENRFYFLKAEDIGLDFGTRLSYSLKDGDKKPDSIALGFYEVIPFEKGEFRANQIFNREVGAESESGIGAELRFQITGKFSENHSLGAESFHDFGKLNELSGYDDQSHTFGPVFKGNLGKSLKYETGYRVGISESAPDHSLKFFLSRNF